MARQTKRNIKVFDFSTLVKAVIIVHLYTTIIQWTNKESLKTNASMTQVGCDHLKNKQTKKKVFSMGCVKL